MHGMEIGFRHLADGTPVGGSAGSDARSRRTFGKRAKGAAVDYEERGEGPTIVFVPGSCSTAAAWRVTAALLQHRFHCVSTSLLGYGGTRECRTASDTSIAHECAAVESVIAKAGGEVHLVGHSFGGLVALAVALRGKAPLASLTIIEAPAASILSSAGEHAHYGAFRKLTRDYFTAYANGEREAISRVIDFYGGSGTFAGWPERVREHAVATTPVNILDWASAFGFELTPARLAGLDLPTTIVVGGNSHPAVQRANELLSQSIDGASLMTIADAAHFMIASHPETVSRVVAGQVREAEGLHRALPLRM